MIKIDVLAAAVLAAGHSFLAFLLDAHAMPTQSTWQTEQRNVLGSCSKGELGFCRCRRCHAWSWPLTIVPFRSYIRHNGLLIIVRLNAFSSEKSRELKVSTCAARNNLNASNPTIHCNLDGSAPVSYRPLSLPVRLHIEFCLVAYFPFTCNSLPLDRSYARIWFSVKFKFQKPLDKILLYWIN